jgi:hypothetical protein
MEDSPAESRDICPEPQPSAIPACDISEEMAPLRAGFANIQFRVYAFRPGSQIHYTAM